MESCNFTFMTCDAKKCLAPTDIDFNFALKNTMTSSENEETPEPKKQEPAPKETPQGKGGVSLSSSSNDGAGGNNQDQKVESKIPTTISEPIDENIEEGSADSNFEKTTSWTASLAKINDTEYSLVFDTEILDNWYLYSQFQDSEDGPYATTFSYDSGDHFELMGKTEESDNRKKVFDKVFNMDVQKFSHNATFTQKIKITDPSKPVTAYFEYQTCDDIQCIMNTDDIFVDVKNGKAYVGKEATKMYAAFQETQKGTGGNNPVLYSNDTIDQTRTAIVATFKNPKGDCGGETKKKSNWFYFDKVK